MADLGMLRRELLVGYGWPVPRRTCASAHLGNLFLRGHGFATTLENALVGPFIAIISFVCSIGNVPLAAALWKGGIQFRGRRELHLRRLITIASPGYLRKLYGGGWRCGCSHLFWCVMSLAGLSTEGIFSLAGLVPTARPSTVVPERFSWGYTSVLDIFFVAVFGLLWALATQSPAAGRWVEYATDPVCGMQSR